VTILSLESSTPHPAEAGCGGKIQELFSSVQGEGIYWGRKQIFIRFFGCNMRCVYCDEPETLYDDDDPRASYVQKSADQLLEEVEAVEKTHGPHHSISLTGGEPLVHTEFLLKVAPRLKGRGFCLYLETNGTLPERLSQLLPYLDIIAMDIKPPSSTQDRPFWEAHRRFLEIGLQKDLFVKIVVTEATLPEELEQAVLLIAEVSPTIPLILQPVTPFGEVTETISQRALFDFLTLARRHLSQVRILGQLHKLIGIR